MGEKVENKETFKLNYIQYTKCYIAMYMYKAKNNTGRKGFYAMCGGGQTEPGGAIHIRLL